MKIVSLLTVINTGTIPFAICLLFSTTAWSQTPDEADLANYLKKQGADPVDYVVARFSEHDLVLLGEIHQVKETCEFVKSLIEPMNRAGVKRLCSEFTPSRFNNELKQIITADQYNAEAVTDLFRNGPWPTWGHREYMDIIQQVWSVNQNLADGEAPFLIVGIDSDWSQVEQFKMDRAERFQMLVDREQHMSRLVRETSFDADQKALVHIGMAHTVKHGIRMAKVLDEEFGDRMFQILMHHAIRTRQGLSPITSAMEKAVADSGKQPVGFDVVDSPFAELADENIPYAKSMEQIAQGYVFLKPDDALSKTTWLSGFINETNFEGALYLARQFRWIKDGDPKTPKELDKLMNEKFSGD